MVLRQRMSGIDSHDVCNLWRSVCAAHEGRTLHQSRDPLRHVSEHHLPPAVLQKTVQRRLLLIALYRIANLGDSAGATAQQGDLIARHILEEEPRSGRRGWSLVSFCFAGLVDRLCSRDE